MSYKNNKNRKNSQKDSAIPADIASPPNSSARNSPIVTSTDTKHEELKVVVPDLSLGNFPPIHSSSNTPEQNAKATSKAKGKKVDIAQEFDHKASHILRTSTFSDSERTNITNAVASMTEEEKVAIYPTIDAQALKHLVDVTASEQAVGFSTWKNNHNARASQQSKSQTRKVVDKDGKVVDSKDETDSSGMFDEKHKGEGEKKSVKMTPRERLELAAKQRVSGAPHFMQLAAKRAEQQAAEIKRVAEAEEERKKELQKAATKARNPLEELKEILGFNVERAHDDNQTKQKGKGKKTKVGSPQNTPPGSP